MPLLAESRAARAALLAVAALTLLLTARAATATVASTNAEAPYALQRTLTCLKHRGATVGRVIPTNRRLRALRDLAQKTSVQARLRGVVIGLAFSRSTADAGLLFDLLTVPKDPLLLEQKRNVIVLSPKKARTARSTVFACLRT